MRVYNIIKIKKKDIEMNDSCKKNDGYKRTFPARDSIKKTHANLRI